jgi:N utilization substance protein A
MNAMNVDEMVAQLLASEGFSSLEEVAYVEPEEISSIEGFDEDTAAEIQARAREFLEQLERDRDEERQALGVSDDLYEIDGLNAAMLVALGKDDIKTMEDFAGCAADDLVGWVERQDGEVKRFEGTLSEFPVSREEAEDMIMTARLKAGWVTEEDLAPAEEETDGDVEVEAEADAETEA